MTQEFTLRKAIELAVQTEQLGAKFYARLANKFPHRAELAELFRQLAAEEEDHEVQFSRLLELAPPTQQDVLDYERQSVLRQTAISQYFSRHEGPFVGVEEAQTELQGLEHALTFEQGTLELYQAIREVMGPSEALDALIDTERGHVARISGVLAAVRSVPLA